MSSKCFLLFSFLFFFSFSSFFFFFGQHPLNLPQKSGEPRRAQLDCGSEGGRGRGRGPARSRARRGSTTLPWEGHPFLRISVCLPHPGALLKECNKTGGGWGGHPNRRQRTGRCSGADAGASGGVCPRWTMDRGGNWRAGRGVATGDRGSRSGPRLGFEPRRHPSRLQKYVVPKYRRSMTASLLRLSCR